MAATMLTVGTGRVEGANQTGLLAQTVCVSPAAFVIVAALPMETLASKMMERLGVKE